MISRWAGLAVCLFFAVATLFLGNGCDPCSSCSTTTRKTATPTPTSTAPRIPVCARNASIATVVATTKPAHPTSTARTTASPTRGRPTYCRGLDASGALAMAVFESARLSDLGLHCNASAGHNLLAGIAAGVAGTSLLILPPVVIGLAHFERARDGGVSLPGTLFIVALLFCVAFSIVLAAVIALIILRRRGLYFSLLTLAFSQIAFEIAYKWSDLTGDEHSDALRHRLAPPMAIHVSVI